MKILFIGDIVGKVGRRMVKEKLLEYVKKYDIDFVIANGENVTHGKGLIRHHYEELIDSGVDCITLGNHYDSKDEIKRYLDRVDQLIRPVNLVRDFPGEGSIVFEVKDLKVKVINVLGEAFMKEEVRPPYFAIENELEDDVNIYIVDYHAEATAEKISMAYALDGKVSALLGTHTHVQTNDARILPKGTAFISDVGMTGFDEGILGFEKESVINKNIFGKNGKFEIPNEGKGVFSAVVLDIDDFSGKTKQIFSICHRE